MKTEKDATKLLDFITTIDSSCRCNAAKKKATMLCLTDRDGNEVVRSVYALGSALVTMFAYDRKVANPTVTVTGKHSCVVNRGIPAWCSAR